MKVTLILVVFFAFGNYTQAQNIYRTVEGHIVVIGEYKGERLVAQSSKLNFYLNYTTKVFVGKIDLKTFKTGVDFLDSLILINKNAVSINFSGTIPDDDFITWKHPVLKLNVPLTVNTNNIQKQLFLDATLEHIEESGTFACSLSGYIGLSISQFNFYIPGLKDSVKTQFVQLLLKSQP